MIEVVGWRLPRYVQLVSSLKQGGGYVAGCGDGVLERARLI
jgi:hypothetical protein